MFLLGLVSVLAVLFNIHNLAELSHKLVLGISVKILHNTVVVHNFKLVGREKNCKEEIELLLAGIIRVLLTALLANLNG